MRPTAPAPVKVLAVLKDRGGRCIFPGVENPIPPTRDEVAAPIPLRDCGAEEGAPEVDDATLLIISCGPL